MFFGPRLVGRIIRSISRLQIEGSIVATSIRVPLVILLSNIPIINRRLVMLPAANNNKFKMKHVCNLQIGLNRQIHKIYSTLLDRRLSALSRAVMNWRYTTQVTISEILSTKIGWFSCSISVITREVPLCIRYRVWLKIAIVIEEQTRPQCIMFISQIESASPPI